MVSCYNGTSVKFYSRFHNRQAEAAAAHIAIAVLVDAIKPLKNLGKEVFVNSLAIVAERDSAIVEQSDDYHSALGVECGIFNEIGENIVEQRYV